MTQRLVAADIGGTHARFALAEVADGRVLSLAEPVKLKTADYASLQTAWDAFGRALDAPLPRAAAIAVASPVGADSIKLTNNRWVIEPARLRGALEVEHCTLVNDFGAVAHAVAQLPPEDFAHLAGPNVALPHEGVVSICGPGTGLGVAAVLREGGRYHVLSTEGGHIDFAPLDPVDDAMLARLRRALTRVSVERIVSGQGIVAIHETLAALEGRAAEPLDDRAIWASALDGSDSLAVAALDRFCMALGAVAGDLALAHGAKGVAIAGGLGLRLRDHLPRSGFAARFTAKGRFAPLMARIPVKLITHAEPGLYGAAAAFAREHG